MSDGAPDLTAMAEEFADKVDRLLAACLPQAPGMEVKQAGSRVNISPEGQDGKNGGVCRSNIELRGLSWGYAAW